MTNIEKLVEAQNRAKAIALALKENGEALSELRQRREMLILEVSQLNGRIQAFQEMIEEEKKKAEEKAKTESAPTT